MDAATAALLGSLVGASSSFLTALAASRTQREIARISARAEHRKLRREPRAKAFQQFVARTVEVQRSIPSWLEIQTPTLLYMNRVSHEQNEQAQSAIEKLRLTWEEIALLGPPVASKPAREIEKITEKIRKNIGALASHSSQPDERLAEDAMRDFMRKLYRELGEYEQAISRQLDTFISAAQDALDDDGTTRQKR